MFKKLKSILILIYEKLYVVNKWLLLHTKYRIRVMNYRKTLQYIKRKKCSISRFGDGEFGYFFGLKDTGFQERNDELSDKLLAVLNMRKDNLLICIPRCFVTLQECNKRAADYWKSWAWVDNKQERVLKLIHDNNGKHYLFGDAQITRPYIDWKNKKRAIYSYSFFRELWRGKNILIVEGSCTRMGVGNDLLEGAKSIQRIIVPPTNAYQQYEKILETVLQYAGDKLVLLALGPTATVLAADLADSGAWVLDIGHLDIEYEWFKMKAEDKTNIPHKFVQEVHGGKGATECTSKAYLQQIICEIKSEE